MERSVRRLQKKLGPQRVEQCVGWLRAQDYEAVARALLGCVPTEA
jgi:hypothetical protein